jgi:lysophospholipase L1-like esterase
MWSYFALLFVTIWSVSASSVLEPQLINPDKVEAVFLGDSLTEWWQADGLATWNANYANFSANFGKQGFTSLATMNQILNEGIGLDPKIVVLLTGGNDLAEFADGETVAVRIATLVGLIQQYTPKAKILLIAITPAGGMPEWIVEQGLIANARIVAMDNGNTTRALDMRYQFADETGAPFPELYQFDLVHFSAADMQNGTRPCGLYFGNSSVHNCQ